jgi:hypothetical protein
MESDHSGLIIVPALIGFLASIFILILRWMLFLSGQNARRQREIATRLLFNIRAA